MSRKPLVKRFTIPLYNREVLVYFNEADALKEMPYLEADASGSTAYVQGVSDDENNQGILFVFGKFEDACPEIIAHEAVHVGMMTLDMAGVPINYENQEALAYVVGYVAKTVTNLVEKHHEALKK